MVGEPGEAGADGGAMERRIGLWAATTGVALACVMGGAALWAQAASPTPTSATTVAVGAGPSPGEASGDGRAWSAASSTGTAIGTDGPAPTGPRGDDGTRVGEEDGTGPEGGGRREGWAQATAGLSGPTNRSARPRTATASARATARPMPPDPEPPPASAEPAGRPAPVASGPTPARTSAPPPPAAPEPLYTAARAAAEVASARAAAGFPGGCETGPGGLYASWEGDGGAGQYSLNFRHAEFSFRDLGGGFVSMDVYSCA